MFFIPYAAHVGSSRQKYSTIIASDSSYLDSVKSSMRYSTSLSLSTSFAVNLCQTFGYPTEYGRFHCNSKLSAIVINCVFTLTANRIRTGNFRISFYITTLRQCSTGKLMLAVLLDSRCEWLLEKFWHAIYCPILILIYSAATIQVEWNYMPW